MYSVLDLERLLDGKTKICINDEKNRGTLFGESLFHGKVDNIPSKLYSKIITGKLDFSQHTGVVFVYIIAD